MGVLLITVGVELGARVSVEVDMGVCVGALVEVKRGISVGAGFGKSKLHDKIVDARIAMTREKRIVFKEYYHKPRLTSLFSASSAKGKD